MERFLTSLLVFNAGLLFYAVWNNLPYFDVNLVEWERLLHQLSQVKTGEEVFATVKAIMNHPQFQTVKPATPTGLGLLLSIRNGITKQDLESHKNFMLEMLLHKFTLRDRLYYVYQEELKTSLMCVCVLVFVRMF